MKLRWDSRSEVSFEPTNGSPPLAAAAIITHAVEVEQPRVADGYGAPNIGRRGDGQERQHFEDGSGVHAAPRHPTAMYAAPCRRRIVTGSQVSAAPLSPVEQLARRSGQPPSNVHEALPVVDQTYNTT